VGIWVYSVPGPDRVVIFLSAGVESTLNGGLGCAQVPKKCRDEGLQVLRILFRSRKGTLSSVVGCSKPRHTLHANKLEPSGIHKGKRDYPSARVYLRTVRSSKEGQMTVPVCLVLRDIAQELPQEVIVISFHLPVGLLEVGRDIVRDYSPHPEDTLVTVEVEEPTTPQNRCDWSCGVAESNSTLPPAPQRPGTIPESTRNCQPAISNPAPNPWGEPRDSNQRHL